MGYRKRLLILGTGKDQIKGILKAREMGLYTVGLDINEKSEGAELVDEFHRVDIKSEDEVSGFVSSYAKPIDGVIAFGVDIPEIMALVANKRNLPFYTDYTNAKISRDKFLAKERMKEFGVNLPEYEKITSLSEFKGVVDKFGYPVVLKPTDNSGARGVLRITDDTNLEWAYEYSRLFSKSGNLILEKFLDGIQISSESFVVDGKVYTVGLSERNYEFLEEFSPHIIENGGDLPPEVIDDNVLKKIDDEIHKCAEAFNVSNGVIKGDLVIKNGRVYIIEVALRLSGGHFSSLEIPLNTGIDFLKNAILMALGEDIETGDLKYRSLKYVSLRYIFPYKSGVIKEIGFPEWMKEHSEVYEYGLYAKVGDKANYPVTSHPERLGYFLVVSDKKNRIEALIDRVYKDVVLKIV